MKTSDPALDHIGLFYGEGDLPGMGVPSTDAGKLCPFLEDTQQFCSLDGEMCPFIGFNYRRCKKYIVNLSRGTTPKKLLQQAPMGKGLQPDATPKAAYKKAPGVTGGPRSGSGYNEELLEAVQHDLYLLSLNEGKKGGRKELKSKKDVSNALATEMVRLGKKYKLGQRDIPKDSDIWAALTAASTANIYKDYKISPAAEKHLRARRVVRDDIGAFLSEYWRASVRGGSRNQGIRGFAQDLQQHMDAPGGRIHPNYVWMKDWMSSGGEDGVDITPDEEGNLGASKEVEDASKRLERELSTKTRSAPKRKKKKATPPAGMGPDYDYDDDGANIDYGHDIPPDIRDGGRGDSDDTPRGDGGGRTYKSVTEKRMTAAAFNRWFKANVNRLDPEVANNLLRGSVKFNSPEEVSAYITKIADNEQEILNFQKYLRDNVFKPYFNAGQQRQQIIQQWDDNVRMSKQMGLITDKDLKFLRNDTRQLSRTATKMNSVMRKLIRYDLDIKNLPGGLKLAVPVRKSLLPTFSKEDYEVRRMSEQAGLLAIQKQHRYGQAYGRYNARNLFFKELVSAFVLVTLGIPELIRPIQRMWPQGWIDARFFANRSEIPKLSRDDKFLASQRFGNTKRRERMMKGWDKTGPDLPPDRAVLHSRWYPTTAKPWSKMKAQVLRQQHLDAEKKPRGRNTWRSSYMPR